MAVKPFNLAVTPRWLAGLIEHAVGLHHLTAIHQRWQTQPMAEVDSGVLGIRRFLSFVMAQIGVTVAPVEANAWASVPESGPVLVVSNHPLGGAEGMAMTEQLLAVRPDTLVLTNELLTRIPELSSVFVGVDVLSGNAAARNMKGLKSILKHLLQGGAVLMYPAGVVSTINPKTGVVEDQEWNRAVAMLARKSQAAVVPCYIEAQNSAWFYRIGRIHRRLRTVLLIREMLNKRGQTFSLFIGRPILPTEYEKLNGDAAVAQYFRLASDVLKPHAQTLPSQNTVLVPLASPPSVDDKLTVLAQLQRLNDYELVRKGDLATYCVPYAKLGVLLPELACARERTFRDVGEGSGQASDSDCFDPHYQHLFVWDHARRQLVGGYRLGRVDEIVAKQGIESLYSHSLYHFDEAYIQSLGQSLEVGRSFVTPEYQRHPRALDMLWQGIGRYVSQNPQYYLLFGCVSISNEYSALARAFLSESLMGSFRAEQAYINDIKPRKPLEVSGRIWTPKILSSLTNISVINQLVGRIDAGKTVPVLLRHYLALNGRFVGFSVNEQFQDSLDGLIVVDLRETPVKYLARYMTKQGAQHCLQQWGVSHAVA